MSIEVNERPLVTFFVCAYQQERFIREAVEGAFAQTYSPLEIILSDDCSPDRTFDIMREMAAAYRGPHKIILNRNETNLGIGGHINRIFELSCGELLVAAAGDDVSLPERTSAMCEAWRAAGPGVHSVFSDAVYTNESGDRLELWSATPTPWQFATTLREGIAGKDMAVLGCSHMFSRRTFAVFGPIRSDVVQEDNVIPLRSLLLGRVVYVPVPLVLYRRHGANLWQRQHDPLFKDHSRRERWLKGQVALLENGLSDVRKASEFNLVNDGDAVALTRILQSRLADKRLEQALAETACVTRIWTAASAVYRKRVPLPQAMNLLMASFESELLMNCWRKAKKCFPTAKRC